jgi:hypothetical protein
MAKQVKRGQATYKLAPAGLMDIMDKRVTAHRGKEVHIVQPHGCPKNGTMGQVFVQAAETGEFIGLVSKHSLQRTRRILAVRDLAAEARDARSRRGRAA